MLQSNRSRTIIRSLRCGSCLADVTKRDRADKHAAEVPNYRDSNTGDVILKDATCLMTTDLITSQRHRSVAFKLPLWSPRWSRSRQSLLRARHISLLRTRRTLGFVGDTELIELASRNVEDCIVERSDFIEAVCPARKRLYPFTTTTTSRCTVATSGAWIRQALSNLHLVARNGMHKIQQSDTP